VTYLGTDNTDMDIFLPSICECPSKFVD
jgi:hypothetical protein